jgi:hypothetical protein
MPVPLVLMMLVSVAFQAADTVPMKLSFERVAVSAGEEAALPIYLVSNDIYRERFQITLEFPSNELTFQKVERDYLAEKANWTIAATVKDHPDRKDRRILKIDVTPGDARFFPSGSVAHANFVVAKDHSDGDILLDAALVAPSSARPVPAAEPAKITVISKPAFGCFFYMH